MSTRGPCQIRCLVCVLLCATLLGSTSSAGGKLSGLTAGGAMLAQAQNVELVGQIGGWTTTLAVQGSYVYLGIGSRVEAAWAGETKGDLSDISHFIVVK